MYSNGDARSAIVQHARDSSSMPPDLASSALWEREAFTRDKFERAERDKHASAKKDWALDNRPPSTRSLNTLLTNAGYTGPPAKRRALGRYAPIHENGGYGSAASLSSNLIGHLWSPSENGKAERDLCGGPSPGYSSSPSMEKQSKDSDGLSFRGANPSPEIRPASSPCFDAPSRVYGNQNSLDGTVSGERERSKFSSSAYSWDASHRERGYRERSWGRPDYHRRTYSLPKLDSPRDWSGGDRDLMEGRIDRYGSATSREPAFSDVLNITSKEHRRYDWRNRDRNLFSGFPLRSSNCAPASNSHHVDNGSASVCLESPKASSPPKPFATQGSVPQELQQADLGAASPKKRARLTWGQGLAKYEKEKIEDDPPVTKKCEGNHHEMAASSPEHSRSLQNGTISPGHSGLEHEERPRDTGAKQDFQVEMFSESCQDLLAICPNSRPVMQEALGREDLEDTRRGLSSPPSVALRQDAACSLPTSESLVLHDVQVFFESVLVERPSLSKDILTHHVEKAELEIERLERELLELDSELGIQALACVKEEEGILQEEIVITHYASDGNIQAAEGHEIESLDSPPGLQSQSSTCVDVPICADTRAQSLPVRPGGNGHVQESVEELDVQIQESCKGLEAVLHDQVPTSDSDIAMAAPDDDLENLARPVGKLGELEVRGAVLKDDWVDSGVPTSIELWNRKIAEQSLSSLAHLNSPKMETILACGKLYASPQEAPTWKHNEESHSRKRKSLESKVCEEKALSKFTELVLAVKFKAQRESLKLKQRSDNSKMDLEKTLQNDHKEDLNLSALQPLTCHLSDAGFMNADDVSVKVQVAQNMSNDICSKTERHILRMPSMYLGKRERELHEFETNNGLVEDPVAAEQERKACNPWSMEEKKLFLDKYFLFGKDFRRIAAHLEHKTVADCVEFYYKYQKTEEFENVRRRHQLRKSSFYRTSAPYLTTNTFFCSRHLEGNAANLEGLTLVAAVAAAMSSPKEYPNSSSRVGSAAGGAANSYPRGVTAEGKHEERRGGKGARSTHTRPKACIEEADLQWSDYERKAFVNAVIMFGKNFYSISQHIGTKTERQCKTFFIKARKGLGLDQLVERHKAILQSSMTENEIATPMIRDMKGKPAICVENDGLQEEFELCSPLPAAPFECRKFDAPCELPQVDCQLQDAMAVNALDMMQALGHVVGDLSQRSVYEFVPSAISAIKQETPTSDIADRSFGDGEIGSSSPINCQVNAAPSVEPIQDCSLEESLVCGEILQFKTEPVSVKVEAPTGGNIAYGVCNGTLSHINTISSPLISAMVPNSLHVTPVVQPAHVKEQALKTETKARREPTSWTQEEKDKFVDVLKVHGKNWDRLREILPGKSLTQIKTYFQNSKSKLGFGVEGIGNGSGRVGSSRKKKVDDSDSSSNAGSVGQNASQNVHILTDDGSLKLSPSIFIPAGAVGSHGLPTEALMYANLFPRTSLEDSANAQKGFHSAGLTPQTSSASIHPFLNPSVFTSPNLHVSSQPYVHPSVAKGQQVVGLQQPLQPPSPFVVVSPLQQPIVSLGIHQTHQLQQSSQLQPAVRMLQELALPAVQQLHKQPALLQSEGSQQALFQEPQQQQQQVAQQLQQHVTEGVLQQHLSPQLLQRQHQQMPAPPVPHSYQQVIQHPVHVNQRTSNQLQLGSNQLACPQLESASQPTTASQQLLQQPDFFQSQLYQLQTKSPAVLQQHQQMQQLQLLQLHWQQQQVQAQEIQAKQVQNHLSQLQPQNWALLNEQQQQLAFFRGLMQVTGSCTETCKQSVADHSNCAKSQQAVCEDSHQSSVVTQALPTSKCQVISDHLRPSDVKLFGQSLLSQPASMNQQLGGKVSSPAPQLAYPVSSSAFGPSKNSASSAPQLPADALPIQGSGWQQIAFPASHSVSSGAGSVLASGNTSVAAGGAESKQQSAHEAAAQAHERLISDLKSKEINFGNSNSGSTGYDSKALFSALLDSAQQHTEPKGPESFVSSDNGITLNKCREQESSKTPLLAGGHVVSQGLPRVLDALVALAEWRLQNVNGGSGRLTDEFLSQSWEALQKDPGSLVEASKAGGSFAQMCVGSGEMLQHLKDNLSSLSASNAGVLRAGSNGPKHLINAQNVLAQSSSLPRVHNGEAGILNVGDGDGRGDVAG